MSCTGCPEPCCLPPPQQSLSVPRSATIPPGRPPCPNTGVAPARATLGEYGCGQNQCTATIPTGQEEQVTEEPLASSSVNSHLPKEPLGTGDRSVAEEGGGAYRLLSPGTE